MAKSPNTIGLIILSRCTHTAICRQLLLRTTLVPFVYLYKDPVLELYDIGMRLALLSKQTCELLLLPSLHSILYQAMTEKNYSVAELLIIVTKL